ncbi:Ankyrin repeats (3 copies)/Ankyrin repeat/Ankyrin repeats (many copies) [Novymonas esmeraldas]|uniref:Ankyrin repeats (3 copies)/Ankyrin repeat/Ankyrin repeats (Many copies) n=1 Tax=Novymonas esmeraldas TaxID=1808958 RepID=A0AAW0EY45_9TRYP
MPATAASAGALPYPNKLQSRQTTTEHREIAAAAVRAYRDSLAQEEVLLHEDDALLSEEDAARLRRRVSNQAAADAAAAQFRDRACDVVASVRGDECVAGDGGIDIFHAACDGDVAALQVCVRSGANVNAVGQPDPARYNGVQLQQRWLFRAPPLIFAAAFGREEAVQFLMAHGADPTLSSTTGLRAVDYAVRRRYDAIVRLLENSAPLS